ncbi:hypothetical protein [Paracoccus sp. (in: a-proteobacteria)]|uniref:hypothetical protein n=1 Tax=Paracoccus sp. TaxID=267 RepID=UPI0026DEB080|nr:hypothetical protein [Paracoccus sp. (in: a-proteobacteria)]MDO5646473.1 hypothetical protein [Paracoccus sp. (in: a-proteobacteria)]
MFAPIDWAELAPWLAVLAAINLGLALMVPGGIGRRLGFAGFGFVGGTAFILALLWNILPLILLVVAVIGLIMALR